MSAHTPGPWTIETEGDWTRIISTPQPTVPIAVLMSERDLEPWQANARLIAAAPDLLEALEAFKNGACWCGAPEGVNHHWACVKARAAIAKAKGTATGNDPSKGTVSEDAESPKHKTRCSFCHQPEGEKHLPTCVQHGGHVCIVDW